MLMQNPKKALKKSQMSFSERPRLIGTQESNAGAMDELDPETFVDTEFFQTLLNEQLTNQGHERISFKVIHGSFFRDQFYISRNERHDLNMENPKNE